MRNERKSRPITAIVLTALVASLLARPTPAPGALSFPAVEYMLTTDIVRLAGGDYGLEFSSILTSRSSWAIRVGLARHRVGSTEVYPEGKREWDIGARWRFFPLGHSPHLLFLGLGWDNRVQDSLIIPTGELGFALHIKPATVMVIGTYGYSVYLGSKTGVENEWLKGIEARVGICF
jgi:hypothetical protein